MLKISDKDLCENCFSEITGEPCSKCGYSAESYVRDSAVLPCGSALMGRYAVGRVIGMGGFGITYLAYDIKMGRRIAIKEFFPFGLAMRSDDHISVAVSTKEESADIFKNGAERFYEEARMVAGFNDDPNIVSVYDFFYENSTAYYTMEYLKGHSLKDHIVKNGVLTAFQAVFLARCVSDALMTVHEENVLHRDVSPDNIMLCENGKVKLIDFGAARQVVADCSQSMSVILKPGFAPLEQYQKKGKQGPWTDIYSLGTTLFYAMTGIVRGGRDDTRYIARDRRNGSDYGARRSFVGGRTRTVPPKPTETTAATTPKVTTTPRPSVTTAATTASKVTTAPKPSVTTTPTTTPKVTTTPKPSVTTTTTPKPAEVTATTPKPVEVKTEVVIGGQTYSTDLTELALYHKKLTDSDVTELKYMTKLTKLSLDDNNLTDISFVKEMPDLKELYINYNKISDISAVKGLNKLEIIGGYDNPVSDISALKGKKSLTLVSFSHSNVTDLSPLSGCTNITSIDFDNCNIGGSLSALKNMSKLESVYLSNCGIEDIYPLAGKKKLCFILLDDNMISDVSPLKDCQRISWLLIENNNISESGINSFYGLSISYHLWLRGIGLTKGRADRIAMKIKGSPEILY